MAKTSYRDTPITIGSDESRWVLGAAQFARIRYRQIYPGVDLAFHGSGDNLENDFVLQPGADPSEITLQFDRPLQLTATGDLEASVESAVVRLKRPVAYQEDVTGRQEVAARFVLFAVLRPWRPSLLSWKEIS